MLNVLRKVIINLQHQPIRLGHRLRGRPPTSARSLKDRLEELNYKDELYTTRIDIGFPPVRKSLRDIRIARLEHLKKLKSDKNLEKLARSNALLVDMDEVRKDWIHISGPYHKKLIADHYGIFEHLYGEGYFVPRTNLEVLYDQNDGTLLPVYYGNVIKPNESKNSPIVNYESDNSNYWTLVLTSLDGHLSASDKEYIHWLVVNIPGNNLQKGETIVNYLQPFPPRGTGYHRYVFILYKQNDWMSYDMPKVTSLSQLDERTFVTRDWYKKYEDHITPAGLAFYQSDWDSSIKGFFHDVLKMKEPVYEYDFPEPYIRPQEWFPLKFAFNTYMDRYRDPKQINKEYLLRKLKNEHPFRKPDPPLKYPNAHAFPKGMPSWLKLHEKKIRLGWGRINDV